VLPFVLLYLFDRILPIDPGPRPVEPGPLPDGHAAEAPPDLAQPG
jgi:hypothetical protein